LHKADEGGSKLLAAAHYRRGLNITTESGGSVTSSDAGRPWLSMALAMTTLPSAARFE